MNAIFPVALFLAALLLTQPSYPAVSIQLVRGRCVGCKHSYQLGRLQFVTPVEGWATGIQIFENKFHVSQYSGVLHTSNAGKTWTPVAGVETYGVGVEPAFWFINAREGWIGWPTASEPLEHLRRTTNGGRGWTKLQVETGGMWVHLRFFDPHLGYAALSTLDGPQFGITRDGGHTWRFRSEPTLARLAYPDRLLFLNPRVGWIGGGTTATDLGIYPRLVRTVDGGGTWEEASFPPNVKGNPLDLFFLDPDHGWLVLWNGFVGPKSPRFDPSTLLRTTDGGRTWSEELSWAPQGRTSYLRSVRYLSDKVGLLFVETVRKDDAGAVGKGDFTVLATFDGGHTWSRHELPGLVGSCEVVAGEVWCSSGMDILRVHVQP